jgi:hypothetical protein
VAVPIDELDWKVDNNAALQLFTGGIWTPNPPGTNAVISDHSFDSWPIDWPVWNDVFTGTGA